MSRARADIDKQPFALRYQLALPAKRQIEAFVKSQLEERGIV